MTLCWTWTQATTTKTLAPREGRAKRGFFWHINLIRKTSWILFYIACSSHYASGVLKVLTQSGKALWMTTGFWQACTAAQRLFASLLLVLWGGNVYKRPTRRFTLTLAYATMLVTLLVVFWFGGILYIAMTDGYSYNTWKECNEKN